MTNIISISFTDDNGNTVYAKDVGDDGQVMTKTATPERYFSKKLADLALEWLRDNVDGSDPQGRINFAPVRELWKDTIS